MKQGRTLEEVGSELERQRQARKDFVADTRSLEMVTDKNGTKLSLFLENEPQCFSVSDLEGHWDTGDVSFLTKK